MVPVYLDQLRCLLMVFQAETSVVSAYKLWSYTMTDPTFSQIEAACLAFEPQYHSQPAWVQARISVPMKAALIAAQSVDRNIYGDCHVGGGCDSVHFMTTTVEARDKIMGWYHAKETLAYHEKHTIPEFIALRQAVINLRQAYKDNLPSCRPPR